MRSQLIENQAISGQTSDNQLDLPALVAACESDNLELIQSLLATSLPAKPSSDAKNAVIKHVLKALFSVKSVAATTLIYEFAMKKTDILFVWKTIASVSPNCIEAACFDNKPDIALYLVQRDSFAFRFISALSIMNLACSKSWIFSENYVQYQAICDALSSHKTLTDIYPDVQPKPETRSSAYIACRGRLFGPKDNDQSLTSPQWKKYPRIAQMKHIIADMIRPYVPAYLAGTPATQAPKDARIKTALAEFMALLINPLECIKYLKFLNDEFKRYCLEKHNKTFNVDPDSYDFTRIHFIYFPVPKDDYVGIKKHSALAEFLTALFRQHGCANKAYKWTGFIPSDISNQNIANGDFFSEDRFDIGLFHGKLSHMLQQAILIYAIQNNEIDLNGLTIQEVLEAHVTYIIANTNKTPIWAGIRDLAEPTDFVLADPYRMSELVMYHGKKYGLDELSDYCIDSFCKGFMRLLETNYAAIPQHKVGTTLFAKKLGLKLINGFDGGAKGIEYSIERDRRLGRTFFAIGQGQRDTSYAVVNKEYFPNADFVPKRYG